MYFGAKTDNVTCCCQHQGAIDRHQVSQEMRTLENGLIKFGQPIISNLLILLPTDRCQTELCTDLGKGSHHGKKKLTVPSSAFTLFDPILRQYRPIRANQLVPIRVRYNDYHPAV